MDLAFTNQSAANITLVRADDYSKPIYTVVTPKKHLLKALVTTVQRINGPEYEGSMATDWHDCGSIRRRVLGGPLVYVDGRDVTPTWMEEFE
jgi:hypothetical protein